MTISYRVKSANQIVLRDVVPGAQAQTTLTIAAGVVVPTTGSHLIDTEAAAASDDLDTITLTNLRPGDVFELTPVSAARVTTVKHGTGNITTDNGEDIVLDALTKIVRFKVDAAGTGVVASLIGTVFADPMAFKGSIDASTNPNYPAADAGFVYKISVAGKIGGASGPNVEVNDTLICNVDSSAAGDHATVGANWTILQTNIDPSLYALLSDLAATGGAALIGESGGGTVQAALDLKVATLATLAALQAITSSGYANNARIYLKGRVAAGDGGEGLFRYSTADLSSTFVRQTISVLTGDINPTTNVITQTAHGLMTGTGGIVTGGDGLTANTVVYYVRAVTVDTYTLHPTYVDAVANTSIVDITGATAFSFKVLVDPDRCFLVSPSGAALDGSGGGFIRVDYDKKLGVEIKWFPTSGPDDTDQINRAIIAAGAGGTVVYPATTLTISDRDGDKIPLIQRSGQTWRGVDRDLSVMLLNASSTDVLVILNQESGAQDCVIEELTIDGNRANITPAVNLYDNFWGIYGAVNGKRNIYRNLTLKNIWSRGLQAGNAGGALGEGHLVEGVHVLNCGSKAISLTHSKDSLVVNCLAEVDAYKAADHPGATDATSASLFECTQCQDSVIANSRGTHIGTTLYAPGIRFVNSNERCRAHGNVIHGATYLGFIQNSKYTQFHDNTGIALNANGVLVGDTDPGEGTCEGVRVYDNFINIQNGSSVLVSTQNTSNVGVTEVQIWGNTFFDSTPGGTTEGIRNNGVSAPATGGTCTVREWGNTFVGISTTRSGAFAADILGMPTGYALLSDGTAAKPSLGFESDPDTGFFLNAAGEIGVASAGVSDIILNFIGLGIGASATAPITISKAVPQILFIETDSNNSQTQIVGGGGSLIISADANNATAGSIIQFKVDGAEVSRLDAVGNLSLPSTGSVKINSLQVLGQRQTTAIAEAAFVENAGGAAINVDSTFAGYTIQQLAEALKTHGLIA